MKHQKKLAVIGSGIKTLSHMTEEAKTYIQQAEVVLYLVNEPILEQSIQALNPNCVSLESLYFAHDNRSNVYSAIAHSILEQTNKYNFVTVVFYGHPTIFASPGLMAIEQAREADIETIIVPGISSTDCLYADLAIDPGNGGSMCIEASEFLFKQRILDPFCHVIIWQMGMLGNFKHKPTRIPKDLLIAFLDKLLEYYPATHPLFLYEAAIYPGIKPAIKQHILKDLLTVEFSTLTTLYIPPLGKALMDEKTKHLLTDIERI